MLRRKYTLICFALVLCVAGIALAKAVKVDLLPWPDSVAPEPDASGHIILNYAKGADKTEVQGKLLEFAARNRIHSLSE